LIIISWFVIPYFAFGLTFRVLFFLSVFYLLINNFNLINKRILSLGLFFILYTFGINYLESHSDFILRSLQLYILITVIIIAPIVKRYSVKEIKFLIYYFLITNFLALILTFRGLLKNNHAARSFSKSGENAIEISSSGVGGYGTVYMSILIIPILILIIKTTYSKKIKILSLLNLLFIILVIGKADFLIAILLTFFQVFYLIYHYASKKIYYLTVVTILGFITYLINYTEKFLLYFNDLLYGTSLLLKFVDITSLTKGISAEDSTINLRSERYLRSFTMMFENPFLGVFSYDDIGKHSQILDMIAQYGFLIGFLLLIILFDIPKKALKSIRSEHKNLIKSFIVTFFLVGLFNNYPMHIGAAIILLLLVIFYNDKKIQFK